MNEIRHSPLRYLCGAYFHQDWDAEHDSWESVVEAFVCSESKDMVKSVCDDISAIISEYLDDSALERYMVSELYCGYYPPGDSMTFTEWLKAIRRHMDAGVAPKDSFGADEVGRRGSI
ncbi:hypothetical protein CA54_14120 [Symmachiella macrocystis]|uniref:CdiI immunity protein domain-containing protein n=1 Tax=Symmachiella macrocystis TaxID=2527985 RepID=A0A5C6BKH0_9PLAN|nr:hypothetical protein CA54_14120 [Symmachiella macrocystis]